MKRTLGFFILFLLAGTFAAQAQPGAGGGQRRSIEERVKMIMEKVTPALSLDKAQKTLTDSAFTNYYRNSDKLRAGMQQGGRPDRTQFEKLATDRDEQLKKIFTADQYKKFKDEVEPSLRPQRVGGGEGRPMGGNRPARN